MMFLFSKFDFLRRPIWFAGMLVRCFPSLGGEAVIDITTTKIRTSTSELCTRGIDTCTLVTMVGQILTTVCWYCGMACLAGPSVWAVYPRQGACVGPVDSWRWALRRKDMSRPLPTTYPAMGKWRSGKTAPKGAHKTL